MNVRIRDGYCSTVGSIVLSYWYGTCMKKFGYRTCNRPNAYKLSKPTVAPT